VKVHDFFLIVVRLVCRLFLQRCKVFLFHVGVLNGLTRRVGKEQLLRICIIRLKLMVFV